MSVEIFNDQYAMDFSGQRHVLHDRKRSACYSLKSVFNLCESVAKLLVDFGWALRDSPCLRGLFNELSHTLPIHYFVGK